MKLATLTAVSSAGEQKVRVERDSRQYPDSDLDHRGNRLR